MENADFCNANCECDAGYVAVSGECAPESDGICGGPADIDCDSVCNAGDSAPDCDGVCAASEDGDDCNNVCDANEGGSNDCNTYCDNNEVAGSPDCDFICQPYENSPTDCNTLCNGWRRTTERLRLHLPVQLQRRRPRRHHRLRLVVGRRLEPVRQRFV